MATECVVVFGRRRARAFIEAKGWCFRDIEDCPPGWQLVWDDSQLTLRNGRSVVSLPVEDSVRRAQSRSVALAKACRGARRVHDALAGWGTDGITLALLGMEVLATERDPRVFAMLSDRVERLRSIAPEATITCKQCDARDIWRAADEFDVVYLDPMFEPHPTGALAGRRMQALAALVQPSSTTDLARMLADARRVARVAMKRRRKDAVIARPDWTIKAKSVRFDVFQKS